MDDGSSYCEDKQLRIPKVEISEEYQQFFKGDLQDYTDTESKLNLDISRYQCEICNKFFEDNNLKDHIDGYHQNYCNIQSVTSAQCQNGVNTNGNFTESSFKVEVLETENQLLINEEEVYMSEDVNKEETVLESSIMKYEINETEGKMNLKDFEEEPRQNVCKGEPSQSAECAEQQEKPYKCSYGGCQKAFEIKGNLSVHMLLHSNETPFKCNFEGCDKAFKQKAALHYHQKNHLSKTDGNQSVICEYPGCNKIIKMKKANSYYLHKRQHRVGKEYPCNFDRCSAAFHDIEDLKIHVLEHAAERYLCGEESVQNSFLNIKEEKLFKWEHPGCTKSYKKKKFLIKHSRDHSDEKSFKCMQTGCTKSFKRRRQLTVHMSVHSDEKPFVCSLENCGKRFKYKHGLKIHIDKHHQADCIEEPVDDAEDKDNATVYICEHQGCWESFTTEDILEEHSRVHKAKKPFKCVQTGCTKSFKTQRQLTVHMSVHSDEKPFVCSHEKCDKRFKIKQSLKTHIHDYHQVDCKEEFAENGEDEEDEAKVYKCKHPQCGKSFRAFSKFKNHTEYHSGRRSFQCTHPGCSKAFKTKTELKRHLACIHGSERPYKCSYRGCKKAFKIKGTLSTHMLLHSAEMSFKCNYEGCDKAFKQIAGLSYHQKIHLPMPDCNQTVVCEYPGCNAVFKTKNLSYYLHKRQHKVGKMYACNFEQCTAAFYDIEDLKIHVTEHTVERFLNGNEGCQNSLSNTDELDFDQNTYHSTKGYSCPYGNCKEYFDNDEGLNVHLKTHGEFTESIIKVEVSETNLLSMKEELSTNDHENIEESRLESCITKYEVDETGGTTYSKNCKEEPQINICKIEPSQSFEATEYQETLKPYICEYPNCGLRFNLKRYLFIHRKIHKNAEVGEEYEGKFFKCDNFKSEENESQGLAEYSGTYSNFEFVEVDRIKD